MGWNDRLEADPYIPPENNYDDYYAQQYSHEEWLEYIAAQMPEVKQQKTARGGLFKRIFSRLNLRLRRVKTEQDSPF